MPCYFATVMKILPISIDVIGPRRYALSASSIHSRMRRICSYIGLDTLGMMSKKDYGLQCEADERALEVCVDLGEGGVDVGGDIRSDE